MRLAAQLSGGSPTDALCAVAVDQILSWRAGASPRLGASTREWSNGRRLGSARGRSGRVRRQRGRAGGGGV
jgi:hypothetical protein